MTFGKKKRPPGFYWVSWGTGGGQTQRVIAEWDGNWWTLTGSEHMWNDVGAKSNAFPGTEINPVEPVPA